MQHHWEKVMRGDVIVSNTAEGLWQDALKYFAWSDANPIEIQKTLTSGKEAGKTVIQKTVRPYSVKALCLHCGIYEEYLRDIRQSQDKTNMYYIVVSRILYIIYTQNMEMATINEYNPIFTARILNLDKEDIPTSAITVNIVGGIPQLSSSENEILEKLELENETSNNLKEKNL